MVKYDYLYDVRIQEVTDCLSLCGFLYDEIETNEYEDKNLMLFIDFMGKTAAIPELIIPLRNMPEYRRYQRIMDLKMSN